MSSSLVHRLREVRVVERIGYRSLFFRLSGLRAQTGFTLRFFVLPSKRNGSRSQAG